jgi:hypothetical protein
MGAELHQGLMGIRPLVPREVGIHETPPHPAGLKCALNPLCWPGGITVTPATFATAFVIARVGCRGARGEAWP